MASVGALHSLRSFRRRLPWALGSLQTAAKTARPAHPFPSGTQRHGLAAFSVNEPLQQWPHRGLSGLSRIAK